MSSERIVRLVAGFIVLASLTLGMPSSPVFLSSGWLWVTAFVGANLLQSAFTRFCPLELILLKAGLSAQAPDAQARSQR